MRSSGLWFLAALCAALSWMTCWQEYQITRLRGDLRAQAQAVTDERATSAGLADRLEAATKDRNTLADLVNAANGRDSADVTGGARSSEFWRHDARRLILNQYGTALVTLDLAPTTLAHLKDLLVARAEAPLDAQEAAEKAGFHDGSADMAAIIGSATTDVNRDIASLLGADAYGRFMELTNPPIASRVPSVAQQVESAPSYAGPGYPVYPADDSPQQQEVADNPPQQTTNVIYQNEAVFFPSCRRLTPEELRERSQHPVRRERPSPPPGNGQTVHSVLPPTAGNGQIVHAVLQPNAAFPVLGRP